MQKTHLFLLLLFISSLVAAQQESSVTNVNSNGVVIEIKQHGGSSPQKSKVDSIKGDNIKIKVDQGDNSTASTPKSGGFQEWISNTTNLFILLGSIAAFIASVWAGIQTLKKIRKRK